MEVEGKSIHIYGNKGEEVPLVLLNTFRGDGSSIFNALKDMTDKRFCLAVISDIAWNDEMTPWECPPLSKNDTPFSGGAEDYLKKLTDKILPAINEEIGEEPLYTAIAGYSLGGLFAIYSLFCTNRFRRAVSVSGSMWFPDFTDYIRENELKSDVDRIYFSLGDKEALTGNPILSSVEEKTAQIERFFWEKGIETVFEKNPGNHFKDADIRMAKGIAWIL